MKQKKADNINKVMDKLSRVEEQSLRNFTVVAIGLGIGVAGLYKALRGGVSIPWTTRQNVSSDIVFYIGGLQNLGNNCFLNVVLQALSSCNSFLLFLKNVIESDDSLPEHKPEKSPLIFALNSLLEELCIIRVGRTVLSPWKVMSALGLYVNHFNLKRQQDAAEAFLHLFSSLQSELFQSYVPQSSSLADITLSSSKVYKQTEGGLLESERWKQNMFGPLDGTVGSILACRSCSSVLSVDSEHFHCLPVSPVLDVNDDIIGGCTLVDCLKHFTTVEHLENYRCARCWHIAAIRYETLRKNDEERINKLRNCSANNESCSCGTLFSPEEIMWSGSSDALKKLIITRCPKILCIHLQRASMNMDGQFVKHEGHISFPLILDLSPFTEVLSALGPDTSSANMQKQWVERRHSLAFQQAHMYRQPHTKILPHMFHTMGGRTTSVDGLSIDNSRNLSVQQPSSNESLSNSHPAFFLANNNDHSNHRNAAHENGNSSPSSSKNKVYHLCAVIEHYGMYGGGHYAAYRRLPDLAQLEGNSDRRWFYVSDKQVLQVSEEIVLSSEASLLFYEMI